MSDLQLVPSHNGTPDFPAPPENFFGASSFGSAPQSGSFAPNAQSGDAGAVFTFGDVDPEFRSARPVFPNGTYDSTIITAQLNKGKASGFRQIKLNIKAYDNDGRTVSVFHYLGLEGDTPEKTKEKLAATVRVIKAVAPTLDLRSFVPSNDEHIERLCAELANRTCRAKLKSETYQGQASNKVDFDGILPPSKGFSFQ